MSARVAQPYFNSRPRVRAVLLPMGIKMTCLLFQFSPSREGGRVTEAIQRPRVPISILALA